MKLIFAGTPELAATVLNGLLQSEHQILAVLTQPDRRAGRGQKLHLSPVKALASAHDIPVYQPATLKDAEIQSILKNYQADLMIVVAYGLLIPQAVLDIPVLGCWNIHVSLLPRWRGAAPIQRAIEAGDSETGVTLMQMDAGLDTGPILLQEKVKITPDMTAGILHDLLATKGTQLLAKGLALQQVDPLKAKPQPKAGVSYAAKLKKEEAEIDWSLPASVLACKIRAFTPWPMCITRYNDQVIRIWQARCPSIACESSSKHIGQIVYIKNDAIGVQTGRGVLEILMLQLPGAKTLPVEIFLNGHRDFFVEDALFI